MHLNKIKPFLYLGLFYLLLSIILRAIFILHPITTGTFDVLDVLKIITVGFLNDVLIFIVVSAVLALYFLFLSNGKYKKPFGFAIFGLFILAFIYIFLTPNNIFKQYGGSIATIALAFIGLKALFFGAMLLLPKKRLKIRNILYFTTVFLYVIIIIFNAVSEYFFWNEFGVRYNFIAVDYLIYTNEVIGNILESYPIIPLFTAIILLASGISYLIFIKTKSALLFLPNLKQKAILLTIYVLMFFGSLSLLSQTSVLKSDNKFVTEIQANGLQKFYYAFTHNELDYFKFYKTLTPKTAEKLFLEQFNPPQLLRSINPEGVEMKKNVVLISIESLSADFLKHYGNKDNITPFLDSLATKSLLFTNLYATGNRTVRGLEALTLCIPPTAGESVVKREDNKNKFSTGSVFKSKGYNVNFLYGGYSYFDNMKNFFEGNGYGIVDRDNFAPEEISFANVWGVADEDMAKKAIQFSNKESKTGQPFFNHWMTVSNHRPFTYPEGRIDISPTLKSRNGGVKYTDFALKQYFAMAKKQSWYKNTVFVIIADHCASSAGKTELPVDKYRIPAMIFSEGFIQPQEFNSLMSQIDVMPTLFGLLNFNYQTKFIGQDVFQPTYQPRAYIATYQDLGLIKDDKLTIISPNQNVKQYQLKKKPSNLPENFKLYYEEILIKSPVQKLVDDCIAAYQSTSFYLKENKLNK